MDVPLTIPPTATKVEIPATVELPASATLSPVHPSSLPPTTTAEQQKITQGQRGINRLWEITQATIAVEVTTAMIAACFILIFRTDSDITTILAALQLLSNASFLIVGFYFSRTNHTKIGGVGSDQVGR